MPERSVLLFVDPTPRGEAALALASIVLPRIATRAVLLAVEDDLRGDRTILEAARARLEKDAPGVRLETRVRSERPRDAIAAEALEAAYDLVVVPPAGRRAIGRWLHGSRTLEVLRHVRAPVLVARRRPGGISKVLVAAAGTPFTAGTAAAGADFARAIGAELRAVHVVDRVVLPFPDHPEAADLPDDPLAVQDVEVRKEIERVVRILADRGFSEALDVRAGLIEEEILDAIEEGGFDLLVVGAHLVEEESRGERMNFAERFALDAPIPVLIHRPRAEVAGAGA